MCKKYYLFFYLFLMSICCVAQPTISSFFPLSGKPGTVVTIKGTGFTADPNKFVFFGPVKASIVSATDTALTVTVPKAATTGKISVTVNKLTGYSVRSFIPFYDNRDSVHPAQFSLERNVNVTINPANLVAGDFNGDGFVDIIATDPKAGIYSILKNNKVDTGLLAPQFTQKDLNTDKRILSTATGDLDGDGKLDMVFGLSKQDSVFISVWRNTSTNDSISFQQIQEIIIGNAESTDYQQILLNVAILDLDKDGKPDIITHLSKLTTALFTSKITLFSNASVNGILNTSSFSNRINISSPVSLKSFTVADLNGDAKAELLGLGADSAIHIFINSAATGQLNTSSFNNKIKLASAFSPTSKIYAEDIDADGKPELLLLNFTTNRLFISRNLVDQTGTITTTSFDPQISFTTGDGPSSLAFFDLNGGGSPDIAITQSGNNVVLLFENKSTPGTLNSSSLISRGALTAPTNASSVLVTDFNNDGGVDIASGSSNLGFAIRFFRSPASSKNDSSIVTNTIPVISSFTPSAARAGETIQITGSGFDTSISKNIIWFGASKGNIISVSNTNILVTVPASASHGPISLTTINNSTVTSKNPFTPLFNSKGYGVFKNSFTKQRVDTNSQINMLYKKVIGQDLDGDGKADLISLLEDNSTIKIFRNTGTTNSIAFSLATDIIGGATPTDISIADFNNDGKPDIVVMNKDANTVSVFKNTSTAGNILFQKLSDQTIGSSNGIFPNSAFTSVVGTGDINNDGWVDIIAAAGNSGIFSILPNKSDTAGISFGAKQDFSISHLNAPFSVSSPSKILITDINEDGKTDIAFSLSNKIASIILNRSIKDSFMLQKAIFIGEGSAIGKAMHLIDIDGDNKKDLITLADVNRDLLTFKNISSNQDSLSFGSPVKYPQNNAWWNITIGNVGGGRIPEIIPQSLTQTSALTNYIINNKSSNGTLKLDTAMKIDSASALLITTPQDINGDGKADLIVPEYSKLFVLINKIDQAPVISSFTPATAASGDTVTIKGYNFTGVSAVRFKDSAAQSFTVISDTLIKAVVGKGASGHIKVSNAVAADSINGFTYIIKPVIHVSGSVRFTVKNNIASPVNSYKISGTNLTGNINISFPQARLMVSRYADSAFQSQLSIAPVSGKIDTTNIYVKLIYIDSLPDSLTINITHSSPGAENKIIPVKIFLEKDSTANIILSTPFGPLQVNAAKGITTPALFYFVSGSNLSGDIKLIAPNRFKISRSLDTGFVKELTVTSVNKRVDSAKIYIQFYSDTVYASIIDSVSHTSSGAVTKYMPIKVTMQPDTTTPAPNKPNPILKIHPENKLSFIAKTGITTSVQSYKITADSITDNAIRIFAPRHYQLSRQADTGFATQLDISFLNGKLDSTNIYVRFKSDSVIVTKTDSITHSTPGGTILKKLAVSVSNCDSVFSPKPIINQITTDGTLVCFKDSTILSVTSPGNLSQYSWSNGATTPTIKVTNSAQISVRVATQNTCLSAASPMVNLVKNTNTKPSIGITSDSILISTTAPFYRWYFNNIRSNADTSNRLIARKVGFYRVETSNNRQCWDASDDLPIITIPRTNSTDTVTVRIFPNPVTGGTFTVVASLERVTNVIARVTVTDASGLVLVQTNRFIFYGREIKIPVTLNTYKGTAFVRVEINGDAETKTIILQ